MLEMRAMLASGGFQMFQNVAFSENLKAFDQLGGEQAMTRAHERHVEDAIPPGNIVEMCIGGFIELGKGVAGCLLVRRIGRKCGGRYRARLDRQPEREYLLGIFGAHRAHEKTAVGVIDQQSFLFEPGERLAQRDFTDAEFACERILADCTVLGQLSGDDPFPHDVENLFGKSANDDIH